MNETENKTQVKYATLRWIAVIPSSVAFCIAAHFLFKLLLLFNKLADTFFGDVGTSGFFLNIIEGGLLGSAFVFGGVLAAPRHKKETAFSLFGIVGAFIAGVMGWLAYVHGLATLMGFLWWCIGFAFGAFLVASSTD